MRRRGHLVNTHIFLRKKNTTYKKILRNSSQRACPSIEKEALKQRTGKPVKYSGLLEQWW